MNTYFAEWWHPNGFWTSGTFICETAADVKAIIIASGGTKITVAKR